MAANGVEALAAAVLAVPASVLGSLLGFIALNTTMQGLLNIGNFAKTSDIELVRKTLYPPFKLVMGQITAVFGKHFTPNPTHILLGALIIVLVLTRQPG